ncbi:phospholipase D-like domain-containing protein [Cellulomonas carbonis]|uniref:Phospholipase D n=1 Tax=Cellulomonas carbonis T26 TaxID=947969 RepID=A0A0A0BXD2_9CELL|nr:phospholipase D-like domain-containing protein [Cellulomonas carbonis]KGM11804.1 phospholipase D [Cellulomonas carbonis T26]GGB92117.1 hypothetical protein GCM10010972_00980 [Cellulomonas carbonis]
MLVSQLFAGDPVLEAVAADTDRISRTRHRKAPAVGKLQQALLLHDPACLPRFGADGDYGDETAGAVRRFKIDVLGVPEAEVIDDVGPRTVLALDAIQAAAEAPPPPPPPPPPELPRVEDWLLDESVMSPFRSPAFTSDNAVTFEVDGQTYMGILADRLDALTVGDQVLLAGWRFSAEQRLRAEPGPGIAERLAALSARGVVVRVLAYGSAFSTLPFRRPAVPALPSRDNAEFRSAVRTGGGHAVLDGRVPLFGSHHQKAVVVTSAAEGPFAFVGGIDLCLDRMDNAAHVDPPFRQREPEVAGVTITLPGWHDVQSRVQGPAVGQVWHALVQRWNDPTTPSVHDPVPVPVDPSEAPGPPVTGGTAAVQVLRTLACRGIYSFLPGGEHTVLAAYRKAIAAARHVVYVEDQYLWPSEVVDDLRDAAARGVHVVLLTSRDYDIPGLSAVHQHMRAETVRRIASVAPGNVHVFHLERAGTSLQIYVHSKLMVVDDLYAAVGSANLNFRSQTTDSELHLGVFDRELRPGTMAGAPVHVGAGVADLRMQLWGEHLNVDPDSLADPVQALAAFPQAPGERRGHVVRPADPASAPPADFGAALREILRVVGMTEASHVLATALLGPFAPPVLPVDLSSLAALVPDPERLVRDFLNPRTTC